MSDPPSNSTPALANDSAPVGGHQHHGLAHHHHLGNESYDYGYDYDYYYLEGAETLFDEHAMTELCHALVFSGFFLFLFVLVLLAAAAFLAVLWQRRVRSGSLPTTLDIATSAILVCGVIKLCPKVWASLLLHGHAAPLPSQTGCKLAAFTSSGMAHVITGLVCALLLAARAVVADRQRGRNEVTFARVDAVVRRHLAWLLLALLALEGAAGMVPAMYVDLADNGQECDATWSMPLTAVGYVVGHVLLFAVLPYLLPLLLCAWPAARVVVGTGSSTSGSPDDEMWQSDRRQARTAALLFISYALSYVPVAVTTVIVLPALLYGSEVDMVTACHFEGAFRIFEDLWFPFAAALVILRDKELSGCLSSKAQTLICSRLPWVRGDANGRGGGAYECREGSNMRDVTLQ